MCPIYKEPKAGSHDSVRLGVGKMAGQVEASLRFPVVYFSVRAITEMRLTLFCFRAIDLSIYHLDEPFGNRVYGGSPGAAGISRVRLEPGQV
jgi:hypothetical protein